MKNEQLTELIRELKKSSIDNKVNIWKRLASDLEKSTRARRLVNIYKIDKYAKENETIVVPGKVLGSGVLTKKVTIAAYTFSDSAYKKIGEKGSAISILELLKNNPAGKKVRILG
jgi:large subunit ribosomal protein L18e